MEPPALTGDALLVGLYFGALRWPKTLAVMRPAVPGSGGGRARLVSCLAGEEGDRAGRESVSQPANGSRFLRTGCPHHGSRRAGTRLLLLFSLLKLELTETQGHGTAF